MAFNRSCSCLRNRSLSFNIWHFFRTLSNRLDSDFGKQGSYKPLHSLYPYHTILSQVIYLTITSIMKYAAVLAFCTIAVSAIPHKRQLLGLSGLNSLTGLSNSGLNNLGNSNSGSNSANIDVATDGENSIANADVDGDISVNVDISDGKDDDDSKSKAKSKTAKNDEDK
ncbi:hypothetical protein N0V93_008858 [Gnomoniopsis smithogilvyi]|uniref:Uncharacterized protein n=1 Tax=Gnomoniopsis smithogilvyi TaxID=1191159 RepID=A0A9W8YIW0_9PEZI|nr:hypothetical protein N0V93_008858 [Gnomoniopsis smithogilvyi]